MEVAGEESAPEWNQLIRLPGRLLLCQYNHISGQEYGCTGANPLPVQSDQMYSIGTDSSPATSLSLSIYKLLLYSMVLVIKEFYAIQYIYIRTHITKGF